MRRRIVWHVIARGHSYAKHIAVSVGMVYNIMKLFESTGAVSAKSPAQRPSLHALNDNKSY